MIYGYARVSTPGQAKDGNSLEAQEKALYAAGAGEVYVEAASGSTVNRPKLEELIAQLEDGDTLIVTKLDRIARSAVQGCELVQRLMDKGVAVHVLNMGLMDGSASGKLIRTIMLAFAEFEKDMIIERTKEGKGIAKLNPNYREGRPKKYNPEKLQHAIELLNHYSFSQVENLTGISKSTLVRAKKSNK